MGEERERERGAVVLCCSTKWQAAGNGQSSPGTGSESRRWLSKMLLLEQGGSLRY